MLVSVDGTSTVYRCDLGINKVGKMEDGRQAENTPGTWTSPGFSR